MDENVEYYRQMLLIRLFEQRVEQLFTEGVIRGTMHPCTGQEAVAVGVMAALSPSDYITSTHRGHGHFLARGGDPRLMMAELFGKKTGYSGGRGGSQLMGDYSLGFLGGNGITGGSIPVATGVGLSLKRRQQDAVAVCFFGDGASNQGTFHESLNMAGLWDLPVLYVCENNAYAMSTPVHQALSIENVADRAGAYGFPGVSVDGNDVSAVRKAVVEARARACRGKGPSLIECKTYRLSGHSRGDQRRYRSAEEEQKAWQQDPIRRFREKLESEGFMDPDGTDQLQHEVQQQLEQAEQFARESSFPDPDDLEKGLYATDQL